MYVFRYMSVIVLCNKPGTEVDKAHQLFLPSRCMKAYADLCQCALYF